MPEVLFGLSTNQYPSNNLRFTKSRFLLGLKISQVAKPARLDPIGLQGLRHTFADRLFAHGKTIEVIRQELGHHDITTTQVYAQLSVTDRMKETYKAFAQK